MRSRLLLIFVLISLGVAVRTHGEEPSPNHDFFEKKIRPVLVDHCYKCHAIDSKKVRGGLLVDSREAIRQGGDSGAGIVPGDPNESLVLEALRYGDFEMPPSGKLSDEIISDFETWIRAGAVDPRESGKLLETPDINIEQGKQFWCFRPRTKPVTPDVIERKWATSATDRFIKARLEDQGIEPVNDADRPTLLRRAHYALTGLPPTIEQFEDFVSDSATTSLAFARVVDRLLDSPEFGERWGRRWLDVVRYAESSGGGRTLLFPDAWRYRDYVIDAFNSDLPYDQFLREQLAGDILAKRQDPADWQTRSRQTVATSFLLLGPTNYELQDKDVLEMDIIDEQLDTIGKAFLGMTIGCARCHDHKFDPIPTADYYALAGILKSTKSVIHSNVSAWHTSRLPVPPNKKKDLETHEAEVKVVETQLAELKKRLKASEKAAGAVGTAVAKNASKKAAKENPKLPKNDKQVAKKDVAKQELVVLKKEISQLEKRLKAKKATGPTWPIAMATVDDAQAADIPIAIRGMVQNPGRVVPRGFLQVAMSHDGPPISRGASGRLELAQWIANEKNPLTARVIVNRVWCWLFGEGLVRSVDNFGSMGETPTHPELLDHLSNQFIADGWSVKRLIRRLMLTHTYRLDSQPSELAKQVDSANRWLSHMNRRRLEAESIRDTLLMIAGRLDRQQGGSGIKPGTKIEYGYKFVSTRRSVYVPVFRNTLPPLFATFDFADPNIQVGKRTSSTIAPQALLLMNSPVVIEQCRAAGNNMAKRASSMDEKIRYCFQQVLSRQPSESEQEMASGFLSGKNDANQWALLYQTLLQSIDFRYVR